MKKLILFAIFSAATLVLSDANAYAIEKGTTITTDEFKRVDSSELTPAVVEQILKEYPTSKLGAVYKNNKGQFKLIMVLQSGSRRTVYIDQYGRWFTPKR
ncbi:MAG: hypothetical protein AAGC45_10340 [Bacteroidota bacterium]